MTEMLEEYSPEYCSKHDEFFDSRFHARCSKCTTQLSQINKVKETFSKQTKKESHMGINTALLAFQSELKPVAKGTENPFFKSTYASLSDIMIQVMPLLNKHGIVLSQLFKVDSGQNVMITKLTHSSGESIQSEIILPINQDPQKQGSIISYFKRYALQAILGITTVDEDDDGNSVSQPTATKPQQKERLATSAQIKYLLTLASSKGKTIETKNLTAEQASALINELK